MTDDATRNLQSHLKSALADVLVQFAVNPFEAAEMSRHFGGSGEVPKMTPDVREKFEALQAAADDLRETVKNRKD